MVTDEKRLQQIIVNLLGNAVKFSNDRGSIKLAARFIPAAVDINLHLNLNQNLLDHENLIHQIFEKGRVPKLVVSIEDSGVGIEPERLSQLFKMFGCVSHANDYNTHGIGLGLFMCKQLVNQFNGLITAESQVGVGSKFTFSFGLEEMGEQPEDFMITEVQHCLPMRNDIEMPGGMYSQLNQEISIQLLLDS